MDRYSDEVLNVETKTRTNKNQELYTDVYMNNVCVDIDNLKNVMKEDDYQPTEKLKLVKENKLTDVTYTDKEYNINILIEEAIKNQKQDNIKRSIDTKLDDMEIDSLIESINENKESKENQSDNLLADLMPGSDNTLVIPPLSSPILEGGYEEESKTNDLLVNDKTLQEVDKKEETLEKINTLDEDKETKEINDDTINDNQESTDVEKLKNEEEFTDKVEDDDKKEIEEDEEDEEKENILDESGHGKVVLTIFLVLIIIFVVIGVLLYKHII